MTFDFLCFWRAFSDAQEGYEQAVEKHQQLTNELLSQQNLRFLRFYKSYNFREFYKEIASKLLLTP